MRTFRISGAAMGMIEGSELYQRPERYAPGQGPLDANAALHAAFGRRQGKGWSYEVTVSEAGAQVIRDYCQTVGETLGMERDEHARREARALLVVVGNIDRAPAQAERITRHEDDPAGETPAAP